MSFSVFEAVTIRASGNCFQAEGLLQAHFSATLIFRQVPRSLHAMTTGKEARPIAHGTPLVCRSETTTAPALAEAPERVAAGGHRHVLLAVPKNIQAIALLVNACPSHLSS